MSEQEKAEEAGNESTISEVDEKDENGQKRGTNQNQQKKRAKSGGKGKLVRSLAVCEESCPRLETEIDNQSP
uniref:Uncharacterized protein n=1 Tax=Sphaerodactylus townsendi TaxID=933632 RepID=A0ACB8FUC5_9SAUR